MNSPYCVVLLIHLLFLIKTCLGLGKPVEMEVIAADDLLPLLIAVICRFPPGNISANLRYTQLQCRAAEDLGHS